MQPSSGSRLAPRRRPGSWSPLASDGWVMLGWPAMVVCPSPASFREAVSASAWLLAGAPPAASAASVAVSRAVENLARLPGCSFRPGQNGAAWGESWICEIMRVCFQLVWRGCAKWTFSSCSGMGGRAFAGPGSFRTAVAPWGPCAQVTLGAESYSLPRPTRPQLRGGALGAQAVWRGPLRA